VALEAVLAVELAGADSLPVLVVGSKGMLVAT